MPISFSERRPSVVGQDGSFVAAIERMLSRVDDTLARVQNGVPHWANPETGDWTVTADGDWTGGAWVGQLWLAHRLTQDARYLTEAHRFLQLVKPRLEKRTAFKGFTFYYAGAAGSRLAHDETARAVALTAAESLANLFSDRLGLIPLGADAEEGNSVGSAETSIDSLQASPLLLWSAHETGNERHRDVALRHTNRVLAHHVRHDGSVVQSATLDEVSGAILRQHTHKGYSATSTWARAQAWALLCSSHCALLDRDARVDGIVYARRTADWWIDNVPADGVSFWDFDDPEIPLTERDTAATAIASAGLLKLADAIGNDTVAASRYRAASERGIRALVERFLTPVGTDDARFPGILTGGCFTKRQDTRPQDKATNAELVFGSYFLLECLAILSGFIRADEI